MQISGHKKIKNECSTVLDVFILDSKTQKEEKKERTRNIGKKRHVAKIERGGTSNREEERWSTRYDKHIEQHMRMKADS